MVDGAVACRMRNLSSRPLSRLSRDEEGAIMVFGVFFAILVVGMLYYFVGIAATIYLRERLQDAADASAFASAVVHARGMNTLALINMIMAAIMSVLVTLRIIEALIIIAQVLLYALAWLGGATAAIASALEVVRQTVTEIAEEAEPIIQKIEVVLHYTGEIVRVITPIGANASVLGKVAVKYEPEVMFGVAIPARLTLPVEDDEYKYLCDKAGAMAGTLVMLPLAPLLPGKIREKIAGAVSDLTGAGSGWFCGDENASPPSTMVDAERDSFPSSQQMKDCLDPDTEPGEDSVDTCRRAEEEEARATPDRETGECRVDDFVCHKQYDEVDGVEFEFDAESYCAQSGLSEKVTAEDCDFEDEQVNGLWIPSKDTPYGRRLLGAREECRPDGKKKEYWWTEREVEVQWDPQTKAWVATGRELSPAMSIPPRDSTRAPCDEELVLPGSKRWVPATDMWNTGTLKEPVCFVDPPPPPALRGSSGNGLTGSRREVLQVLGCSAEVKPKEMAVVKPVNLGEDRLRASPGIGRVESDGASTSGVGGQFSGVSMDDMPALEDFTDQISMPDMGSGMGDLGGGMGDVGGGTGDLGSGGTGDMAGQGGEAGSQGGGGDSENMSPFRFEKGHLLGTSDMQIRALVVGHSLNSTKINGEKTPPEQGKTAHSHAKRIVDMSKWGQSEGELSGLASASEVWGQFAVAQAEYYFKVDDKHQPPFASWGGAEVKEPGARDYLWYMGWTARMRRFRLSFEVDGESADGESKQGSSDTGGGGGGGGGESGGGMSGGGGVGAAADTICKFADSICPDMLSELDSFDGLFLH